MCTCERRALLDGQVLDQGEGRDIQHKVCKNVPGPEGEHKAHPGKEEYSPVHVDGVEDGDAACLFTDRAHLGRRPEAREGEARHHNKQYKK